VIRQQNMWGNACGSERNVDEAEISQAVALGASAEHSWQPALRHERIAGIRATVPARPE